MATTATGLLRGTILTLDRPVPPLDGQRVRVVIESDEGVDVASKEEHAARWAAWVARGPQGPIDDDDDWPDDA